MRCFEIRAAAAVLFLVAALPVLGAENVYLTEVPDYEWHGGCFGTASGNLMGFWDRHGLPNLYQGPTAGGVAPLTSSGSRAGILSLWSSKAGRDGRPTDQPGHEDDYWADFGSPAPDPYVAAGRAEHLPDCIGDFIGLSQLKWSTLNSECEGNIDGYSFNFFDPSGARRVNFTPPPLEGRPVADIQSGLRAFAGWRGYEADSFSQLCDFNPATPAGAGFTFDDLVAEIRSGHPVLVFMQAHGVINRPVGPIPFANPDIHALLIYGYLTTDEGIPFVRFRTSWASGDNQFNQWNGDNWIQESNLRLPVRGVIGFHPKPRLTGFRSSPEGWVLEWHGPLAMLKDDVAQTEDPVHWYVVERSDRMDAPFTAVTAPMAALRAVMPHGTAGRAGFFRVRLVSGPSLPVVSDSGRR